MDLAPLARHTQVEDLGDRLVLHFLPRRAWGEVIALAFFFVLWTIGGCAAVVHLIETHDWTVLFFLLFWLPFDAVVGFKIADALLGRETLIVTTEDLEVRHEIGRIPRSRFLDAALVNDVTAAVFPTDDDEAQRSGYCLKVAYGDKYVRIGEGMSRAEAEYIATLVLARIRSRRWWDEPEDEAVASAVAIAEEAASQAANRGWRNLIFPVFVVAALAWLAFETLSPASKPQRAAKPVWEMPRPHNFSTPHAYAVAMTTWALNSGPSRLVSRPRCDVRVTWAHWSCRALASSYWHVKAAGLAVPYRCESVSTGGVTCGLATPLGPVPEAP